MVLKLFCRALGELAMKLSSTSGGQAIALQTTNSVAVHNVVLQFVNGLQQFLTRNLALHKMVIGLVLTFWKGCGFKEQLVGQLTMALTGDGGYEDLMPFILAMQKDCHVST